MRMSKRLLSLFQSVVLVVFICSQPAMANNDLEKTSFNRLFNVVSQFESAETFGDLVRIITSTRGVALGQGFKELIIRKGLTLNTKVPAIKLIDDRVDIGGSNFSVVEGKLIDSQSKEFIESSEDLWSALSLVKNSSVKKPNLKLSSWWKTLIFWEIAKAAGVRTTKPSGSDVVLGLAVMGAVIALMVMLKPGIVTLTLITVVSSAASTMGAPRMQEQRTTTLTVDTDRLTQNLRGKLRKDQRLTKAELTALERAATD